MNEPTHEFHSYPFMARQNNTTATRRHLHDPLTNSSQSHANTRHTDLQDSRRVGNSRARVRKSQPAVLCSKSLDQRTSIATSTADLANNGLSTGNGQYSTQTNIVHDKTYSRRNVSDYPESFQGSDMSSTRRRTNSTSSTSTTSLSYLRKAAAEVIAQAHQTHLKMKALQQQQQQQLRPTQLRTSDSFEELRALSDEHGIDDSASSAAGIRPEYRHLHHYYQYHDQSCEPEIEDTVAPQPYLRHSQTKNKHQQLSNNFSTYYDYYHNASNTVSAQVVPEYNTDTYHQHHSDNNWPIVPQPSTLRSEVHTHSTNNYQQRRRQRKIQPLPQPIQTLHRFPATESNSVFSINTDDNFLIPELSSGQENLVAQLDGTQINPLAKMMREEVLAMTDQQTPLGEAECTKEQYYDGHTGHEDREDRELYKPTSRRERGYTPGQDIHRDLISSIRSSFLASQSNSNRSNSKSLSDTELQPWLGYIEEQVDSDTERQQQEEARDRLQERRLLDTIAQLEQEVADLRDANRELQACLHTSKERYDSLVTEHSIQIRHIQDEHELSKEETKKRTKKFHDEAMRKRQKDEERRLTSMQDRLQQVQKSNKELSATIRALQREKLETERGQRDDLVVLNSFLENEIVPTLQNALATPVMMDTQQKLHTTDGIESEVKPLKLQAETLWDNIHQLNFADKLVESPSSILPKAKLNIATTNMDHPCDPPMKHYLLKGEQSSSRSCSTSRGRKCLNLLEQLWAILITVSIITPTDFRGHTGDEDRVWRNQQKRHSDSSSISSGKTLVVPRLVISGHPMYSIATATAMTTAETTPTTATDPAQQNIHTALISDGHKDARESLDRQTVKGTEQEQHIQYHLEKQRVEHHLEIERIKQQCTQLYRDSLEDVRTEILARIAQKKVEGQTKKKKNN
ncbi:hypothetical protein BGX27_006743 [Mortierella sp. AM989]|nr:hypothetical protein BGX27_006743 [Mortierella sp. AM989]